jgi:hypothetical protein
MTWLKKWFRGNKPARRGTGSLTRSFRPSFEALEDRQLLSATAISNLMNVSAQFNLLPNGHLQQTIGTVKTDLGIVQGLYQGKDSAGHLVAYDWAGGTLNEFNGQGWTAIGAADTVVQDATDSLLFTHAHALSLASGAPDRALTLLQNIQGLTTSGDHFSIQVGSLVKADLTVTIDPTSGAGTLGFTKVQLNVGGFLNNVVHELQSFTKPLESLADRLTTPVFDQSWASSLTPLNLLNMLGYNTTSAQAFVSAVHGINNLTTTITSWVAVGDFTVRSPGGNTALALTGPLDLSAVSKALSPLRQASKDIQVALDDGRQLLNLLTGAPVNLFGYSLQLDMTVANFDQRLATIPISPETATELDLDLVGNAKLSGAATFGFDSTGLQSGNLAQGLYIQNASVTATLTIGLAGTINEAYLVGYRLTGQLAGTVTVSLPGKVYADKLFNGSVKVQISDSVKTSVVTQALGPKDLLGQYLTPQAAAAAAKAFKNGLNDAGNALNHAYNSVVAQDAKALAGVGKTAAAIATALQGLYTQQADAAVGVINSLDNAAAKALKSGAATLGNVNARILSDVSNSAKDIAGLLKGIYNKKADETAKILKGLNKTADEIAGALTSAYNTTCQDIATILNGLQVGVSDIAHALYGVTHDRQQILNALQHIWADPQIQSWNNWLGQETSRLNNWVSDQVNQWRHWADPQIQSWKDWLGQEKARLDNWFADQAKQWHSWADPQIQSWNNWLGQESTRLKNWVNDQANQWHSWADPQIQSWNNWLQSERMRLNNWAQDQINQLAKGAASVGDVVNKLDGGKWEHLVGLGLTGGDPVSQIWQAVNAILDQESAQAADAIKGLNNQVTQGIAAARASANQVFNQDSAKAADAIKGLNGQVAQGIGAARASADQVFSQDSAKAASTIKSISDKASQNIAAAKDSAAEALSQDRAKAAKAIQSMKDELASALASLK